MWRCIRVGRRSAVLLVLGGLIAAALLSGPGVALASHNFSDVPDSVFYHDFVDFLVQNGITSGCGGGQYCGEDAVSRGQIAVFLQRLALVLGSCSPDSVHVGPACVDKYEASVWRTLNAAVIQKIRRGTVTGADLTAAGATHLGLVAGDLATAGCPVTGNGCVDVYAVSIPGVLPSARITWFQAAAAARNAGKRLPTNAEWQAAALGTPDGPSCNTSSGVLRATGPPGGGLGPPCVSDVGAFDMVGNLWEWVADWVPRSTGSCGSWGTFSDDFQCLVGAATTGAPGALVRGGVFVSGTNAGVFAVVGSDSPSSASSFIGFRGAR
jgi:sulfatase-modifying factor enzyme 1